MIIWIDKVKGQKIDGNKLRFVVKKKTWKEMDREENRKIIFLGTN